MIYLEIFISFLKIGLTSFGGLSMVPLITSEMLSHGWMTQAEVTDIIAIAEMTPGPLGLNCASFAGMKTMGLLGAIMANLGVLFPSLTIAGIGAMFLKKFKDSSLMKNMMQGIRPACAGMLIGVAGSLAISNYFPNYTIDFMCITLGLCNLVLLMKYKFSIPKVIGLNAIFGIVLFGILKF